MIVALSGTIVDVYPVSSEDLVTPDSNIDAYESALDLKSNSGPVSAPGDARVITAVSAILFYFLLY
jgi:hypothetical protein